MPRTKSGQLALDLTFDPSYSRDDFMEGNANADALRAIESSMGWSFPGLIITGEEGAGKTHLARIWARSVDAVCLMPDTVTDTAAVAVIEGKAAVLEDVDQLDDEREATLFRIVNACVHGRTRLLITARNHPGTWNMRTADVASRLKLFPVIQIRQPDDALLTAILMKQLADRQIAVKANAVLYAAQRLERSFSGVGRFVDVVEQMTQHAKGKLTRGLARDALIKLSQDSQATDA